MEVIEEVEEVGERFFLTPLFFLVEHTLGEKSSSEEALLRILTVIGEALVWLIGLLEGELPTGLMPFKPYRTDDESSESEVV